MFWHHSDFNSSFKFIFNAQFSVKDNKHLQLCPEEITNIRNHNTAS